MHNFNWLDKEGTKGGNEGGGFVRAVRVCLASNLPNIVPSIRKLVCEELDSLLPLKKLQNVAGAITIALQDLCLHPEYLEPLRQDIDNHYLDFKHTAQGLSLLDSFIKESARLTPTEALSTRRYAVESHTFSDGTHLNRGDWACTPRSLSTRS
ncbi:uncharacterized protein QC763_0038540 [Podospora pseudopauciseta]|uniref:Uncharacterized protein n=1 Tax=Podospora pseudopauciseta TaxID=2093780 RepID=A0ABR0HQ77_9PEZI|nr:hypothetical protein QC763_0038540 [Podospora pseudopauciseta]